jgi:hypothetical protein
MWPPGKDTGSVPRAVAKGDVGQGQELPPGPVAIAGQVGPVRLDQPLFTRRQLDHYADEAVRVFLAAYGAPPAAT